MTKYKIVNHETKQVIKIVNGYNNARNALMEYKKQSNGKKEHYIEKLK